ncbi:hypothetical protein [Kribbella aluminosa]|uniref:hypothetical protein n=1 Tax=Kribbella aluminosa TaxID=416017 RepID=UPI001FD8ED94|nr:hypothetical protein [Kribbella aluminosa]
MSAAFRDKGAIRTGFDQSTAMLDLARQRLGADADLSNWHRPLQTMTSASSSSLSRRPETRFR